MYRKMGGIHCLSETFATIWTSSIILFLTTITLIMAPLLAQFFINKEEGEMRMQKLTDSESLGVCEMWL